MNHSLKQQDYLYQVILSNSTYFLYLPKLQSFKTGWQSFKKTTSLSLSSNYIQFYFSLYLPQLNQISLGRYSFEETTFITLQSTFVFSLFPFLDVPFSNGNYSVAPLKHPHYIDNQTFHHISSSSITSDSSTPSFPSSQIASQSLKNKILNIHPV